MTLFTRSLCSACQEIRGDFDLKSLGVQIDELGPDNPDALAHLAWHELVEIAEKNLPILVLNDSSAITDTEKIKDYLVQAIAIH